MEFYFGLILRLGGVVKNAALRSDDIFQECCASNAGPCTFASTEFATLPGRLQGWVA